MDIHHSGSDELIYINTDKITLIIKGPAYHPSLPGVEYREKESSLQVVCEDDYDISIHGESELTSKLILPESIRGDYAVYPLFFEQQNYELIVEATEEHTIAFWHENYKIRNKVTPVGRSHPLLSGVINFANEIGYSDLVIKLDGKIYLRIKIEVFPSKMNYKDDYKAILSDVTAEIYNLVFDFLKKTYRSFDITSTKQSSLVEFFAIIEQIYHRFITAADMILRNPHHVLQKEYQVLPSHKAKQTDMASLRWARKHPDQMMRREGRVLVDRALAVKKAVTYDTKENRLTKYMLTMTARKLAELKRLYLKLDRETDQQLLEKIDHMIQGIDRRSNTGFLRDIEAVPNRTGMSLIFGMALGYRELYHCYLLLQHGLSVTGSIYDVSLKDLAVLYEYWCFIKLNSLLREKYELVSQDIIHVKGDGIFVSLVKGQSSTVRYRNPLNGETIVLSYNPKEINVPTVTQRPDNVLSLKKQGASNQYEYTFDAKYRINAAKPHTAYYNNISHIPGPEVDDINTMHRYRDAIVYQRENHPYERKMFGAYVLFPYHDEEEYQNHRFYQSIEQVNIGGLPFLPSATKLVTEMLDELIADSPETAFERATLPVGIEEKLAKVNWKERDVLVGTLSEKEQLDNCLNEKVYTISAAKIDEDRLPIRYVAIYQQRRLFKADARIEYYGEVISSNMIDGNYQFHIKEWKKLARPIEVKENGVAHFYTNTFLLKHSSQVPELMLRSEEEYRFYTELKRRTDATVVNDENQDTGFYMGDVTVMFDDRNIVLFKDKLPVKSCLISEFARKPNATFRKLMNYQKY